MHAYQAKSRLTSLAAIILCTLSLLTPPAQADGILCNGRRIIGWLPTAETWAGEITRSTSNLVINGSTAYVQLSQIYGNKFGAFEWGSKIGIVDISNPESPVLINTGFGFNPNSFNDITISDDILYIANRFDTITLYDISNPSTPSYLSSITPPNPLVNHRTTPLNVRVEGIFAYLAFGSDGIHIYDVADPSAPKFLATYDTPSIAYDVTAVGSTVYIADFESGLIILDASDPTSPTLLGTYNTPGGARQVEVRNQTAYIADEQTGLVIVDVSNPASPTLLSTSNEMGDLTKFTVENDKIYTTTASTLASFDVSDPTSPTLVQSHAIPSSHSLIMQDSIAHLTTGSGFLVFDASTPLISPPSSTQMDLTNYSQTITQANNLLFTAMGESGIQILDNSNPLSPTHLSSYDTPGFAWDILIVGNRAYIADGEAGLVILDITNPSQPALLGIHDTPGEARSVAVIGDIAYVADKGGKLQIINVADPNNLGQIGEYLTNSSAFKVLAVNNLVYVIDGRYGSRLTILDVTTPQSPQPYASFSAADMSISNNAIYLIIGDQLQIYDVSIPSDPVLISTTAIFPELTASRPKIQAVGNRVYLQIAYKHIYIFDASDRTNPELVAWQSIPGIQDFHISPEEDIAYITTWQNGDPDINSLLAIDLTDCPPCLSDFTNDGIIDFFDVSAFLQLFADQDPAADLTTDGIWDFFDVSSFLQDFAAGCP